MNEMSKRKRDEGLAEGVLAEKLDFLESKGIQVSETTTTTTTIQSDTLGAWDYLLDVCLKVEEARGVLPPPSTVVTFNKEESEGVYDYDALQDESIHESCKHTAFIGPVRISPLPEPKVQGVVASRDVLKGELLCSSVPEIVVPNLVPRESPALEHLLFSDLSRAEMTAKLILLARHDPTILFKLKKFEYAKSSSQEETSSSPTPSDDTVRQCQEIISNYTWAIDHSSKTPAGKVFRGQYTKVAGHAFTIDGFAGKFNHSCVPNATMISYGAVQFFRANCSIPAGTEICVSYGSFDPSDPVQQRKAKLFQHAGFICSCPLCLYESSLSTTRTTARKISTPRPVEGDSFEALLKEIILDDDIDTQRIEKHLAVDWSSKKVLRALNVTATLMDGDLDGKFSSIYEHVSILQLLLRYSRILPLAELASAKIGGIVADAKMTKHCIITNCILLCLMFSTLMVDKPHDVGIAFGDLYRPSIAQLAKALNQERFRELCKKTKTTRSYVLPSWWLDKSLEYTDCF